MSSQLLYFSGLQGATGDYALPPCTPRQLAALAGGTRVDSEEVEELRMWTLQGKKGLREGDPRDLAQAGWGVLFAQEGSKEIQEALRPLLEHRRGQAARVRQHFYREYSGSKGYLPGDTKRTFLDRHGVGPGAADPEDMPYYLLIVGDPETIPYSFQYQLDVERAVGRIWFETPEEYERYARSVVESETAPPRRRPRTTFFAPDNPGDPVTPLCVERLATPLASRMARRCPEWEISKIFGDDATKQRLSRVLGGEETPDLLFTAGHGMVFSAGDPRLLPHQGALLCRDWPGPSWRGKIPTDFYFSGEDVNGSAGLNGLVAFLFACYSAGAPAWDDYKLREKVRVAPHAFLTQLPDRLLSHPRGGALAVIGHVDLAWVHSFDWPGVGAHIQAFEDAFRKLMEGYPVGSAMESFGRRYAELSTELSEEFQALHQGKKEDENLFFLWSCANDSRNYIVLGDPAVRIPGTGNGRTS